MADGYAVVLRQRTYALVVFQRWLDPDEIERCDDIVLDGVTGFADATHRAAEINRLPGETERRAYRQQVIDDREDPDGAGEVTP